MWVSHCMVIITSREALSSSQWEQRERWNSAQSLPKSRRLQIKNLHWKASISKPENQAKCTYNSNGPTRLAARCCANFILLVNSIKAEDAFLLKTENVLDFVKKDKFFILFKGHVHVREYLGKRFGRARLRRGWKRTLWKRGIFAK